MNMQPADRYGTIGRPHHVVPVMRGDYLGRERTQHGPVMATHHYRPDGSYDTRVFAPTATTTTEAHF